MSAARRAAPGPGDPLIEVRESPLHGLGVFALRRIPRGTRVIEYLGERISHQEADRRYQHKSAGDAHTFLFIADAATVIDAGVEGNEARFVNHACRPNCESVIEHSRVFIDAIRSIAPGEELTYDYQIQREADDPPDIDRIFACRCGSPGCRGTMLGQPRRPQRSGARAGARTSRRR
jgi:SET domain-containing protein